MDLTLYVRGIEFFNSGEFYDAHEVLEDVWREERGPNKLFLQGLIQVAVALHHHSTGNVVGCRSLLKRAALNLSSYPDNYFNLHLTPFRASISAWESALDQNGPLPPFPKLEIVG
jgi:predicted metal-dependent hydrolase